MKSEGVEAIISIHVKLQFCRKIAANRGDDSDDRGKVDRNVPACWSNSYPSDTTSKTQEITDKTCKGA
jgi:hypothetical protein